MPEPEKTAPQSKGGRQVGGRDLTCPDCGKVVNSHGMHIHMKNLHPEKYEAWKNNPDRLGHGIHDKTPSETKISPLQKVKKIANSKWNIPFPIKGPDGRQTKQYYRAWSLCRKHNLPYAEAVKAEEAQKQRDSSPSQIRKPTENVEECSEPQELQNSHDAATLQDPLKIVTGLHVRQIKPDQGRQIFGTGMVIARHGDIVHVRNGGGKVHKIDAKCLQIVSTPISDKAAGEAA